MKIGILGNMNNAYFALTRYLRDKGLDCELMIFENEPEHFDPSFDTNSSSYTRYCKKLTWGDPAGFLSQDFEKIRTDIEQYDVLIGNGPAPAYVSKVGRKLDIFMPYGYDLYSLPFVKVVHPLRQAAYLATRRYQRRGIREADYILFDRTNKEFEKVFTQLHFAGRRIVCPSPMLYDQDYLDLPNHQPVGAVAGLQDLRESNDLVIVQNTRQVWKHSPDQWSDKGNDELFKGFKTFVDTYPHIRCKLVVFEYGNDVDNSKKLIADLQLTGHVLWLPKMARKELMSVIAIADLAVGELEYSWLTYGVVLEALALGKPLMHHRKDEEFISDYPELYPMICAHDASSVFKGLQQLITSKEQVAAMGLQGRKWFERYCVEFPLTIITNILEQKKPLHHA